MCLPMVHKLYSTNEAIMKKIVAVFLGVSMSNCVLAGDGSPELKSESQAVIRNAGYQCDKVNGVFPATFGGSVTVFCDDVYQYVIKDKGGRYTVAVND